MPEHTYERIQLRYPTEFAERPLPADDADAILVQVSEPFPFPKDYPLFGKWVPRESFVDNWAGSEFVRRLIDEELHVGLAKEASHARNGLKCMSSCNSNLRMELSGWPAFNSRVEDHQCVGGFRSFENAADAMRCEIATMALVKQRTLKNFAIPMAAPSPMPAPVPGLLIFAVPIAMGLNTAL